MTFADLISDWKNFDDQFHGLTRNDRHGVGSSKRSVWRWTQIGRFFRTDLPKPADSLNRLTIGGPIYIPGKYNKDRNKTFFFYSQEHRRIITYTTFNPILPTAAMLTGNFSQPVCITVATGGCPAGSTPVNQIPANLINPNSAAYIKDIYSKLPLNSANTVAATTSGFFAQRNLYNSDMYIARIDHTFNDKFRDLGQIRSRTKSPPPNRAGSLRDPLSPAAPLPTPTLPRARRSRPRH